MKWLNIAILVAVAAVAVFGAVLVIGNNLPQEESSTDLVEDSSDDGKRIVFVNDDMDDAPAGWEWVIEKSDEGNDILILKQKGN